MSFTEAVSYNTGLTVVVIIVGVIVLWQFVLFLALQYTKSQRKRDIVSKHVFITGGSKGLGLALAAQFANLGANVTIVARGEAALKEAKQFIEDTVRFQRQLSGIKKPEPKIFVASADVSNEQQVTAAIETAERELGPIYLLISCAGKAWTGYFLTQPLEHFKRSIELNYYGLVTLTKTVAPLMVERKQGHIICVSSGLALTTYLGYSSYCPAKHAIRGFANVLRQELLPYNVHVYNAFPPTMDTEGYRDENKTKPAECQAIESLETVYSADVCASSIVDSFLKGEHTMSCGDFGINLLVRSTAGIGPRNNTLADFLLSPLLVIVSKVYSSWIWDREVLSSKYDNIRPRPELRRPIGGMRSSIPLAVPSSSERATLLDGPLGDVRSDMGGGDERSPASGASLGQTSNSAPAHAGLFATAHGPSAAASAGPSASEDNGLAANGPHPRRGYGAVEPSSHQL